MFTPRVHIRSAPTPRKPVRNRGGSEPGAGTELAPLPGSSKQSSLSDDSSPLHFLPLKKYLVFTISATYKHRWRRTLQVIYLYLFHTLVLSPELCKYSVSFAIHARRRGSLFVMAAFDPASNSNWLLV